MKIRPFKVEEWMNAYEVGARYNIAETCVDSVSLDELFALTGEDPQDFWRRFSARRLTYGDIEGAPAFREGICRLYRTLRPEHIVPTHGAAGANHHIFYSLLEPGDRVVCVQPTYQQLYSIPESFGAEVALLPLRPENGWLPDLDELRRLVTPNTRMICINNPNNPTGALMSGALLEQIAAIARGAGAGLLSDEVYRHLTQDDSWSESVADLYEKGISVSSMSKVFSLAGLRLGWIAARDPEVVRACFSHRDYNLISCGMFDEAAAALALTHADRLLARSRGIVRGNLSLLADWVARQPHVGWVRPQAGTTALVSYDFDLPSRVFCKQLYDRTGALVTPGECFEIEHCMRIGYASDRATLLDGLRAIDSYIAALEAQKTPLRAAGA